MYLSIFLNEIRIWTIWLVQFISPNLHRVRGHKFVLENTIYNEEIPTSISVYRSRSNNNEEVSCPTYTSMGQYLLDNNVISLLCFILVQVLHISAREVHHWKWFQSSALLETLVSGDFGEAVHDAWHIWKPTHISIHSFDTRAQNLGVRVEGRSKHCHE